MLRAPLVHYAVRRRDSELGLGLFLEEAFAIVNTLSVGTSFDQWTEMLFNYFVCRIQSAIEIDRSQNRFQCVGKD